MSGYIQVITTVSNKMDAKKIADILLDKRLVACVQIIGPIKSIYRWKHKIETAKEWICISKTRKSLYKAVEKVIKKNHPYEVPEIIVTSITQGSKDYLKWISKETRM
jgi:periplasmic divalent cation tolerance protein